MTMTRAQRSQLREILLQLTELRAAIESIQDKADADMSTHEAMFTARAIADIKNAITHLQGVI